LETESISAGRVKGMTEQSKARIILDTHAHDLPAGTTVMEGLVGAGVLVRTDCGGKGRCGKCLIKPAPGAEAGLSAAGEAERKALGPARAESGYRLACCARVTGEVALAIPEESRVAAEVVQKGLPMLFAALGPAPAPRPAGYGVAVDVGTTTIAVYLCDLAERTIVGSTSARNPQAIFGDDVVSRIGAVRSEPGMLPRLQRMAVSAIDWAVKALCRQARVPAGEVAEVVAVGNSTMVHLLLGESPASIGVFPYAPLFVEDRLLRAGDIGLAFNPAARLRTLPLISGYLGADIVSAAIAADLTSRPAGTLLADVGTNGEIILASETGLAATSCATGPAFEGAAIRHGMQATSGAIDSVRFNPSTRSLDYTVIRRDSGPQRKPSGICGSGVINAVAELLKAGVVTPSGSYNAGCGSPRLQPGENNILEFEIAPPEAAANGRAVTLTQADVRAVQLAKGALRAGIDLLCRQNGLDRPRRILLAGAFGSFIDRADALKIGMFPEMPIEAIEVVGNAAGAGAVLAMLDPDRFEQARRLARTTAVLDLAGHPDFQATFVGALGF
jgi:uncharacterized 2Fe-2S/4Fe-4S cluster protein (DUF4445 family)